MNYLHKAMQIKQQVQLVGLPLNLELIVITKGESFNILMLMIWPFIGDTIINWTLGENHIRKSQHAICGSLADTNDANTYGTFTLEKTVPLTHTKFSDLSDQSHYC